LGDLLTSLLQDIGGIQPCPVTPGGEHSYWLYVYQILAYDPKKFVEALAAEGIPTTWGYGDPPLYLRVDALATKRPFGKSSYPFMPPFTDRTIEYRPGLCPVAERESTQIGILRIFESWSEADIHDIAEAFRKIAAGLDRR